MAGNVYARIMPNPSTGDFTLILSGFNGTVAVDVIDLSGNIVHREQLHDVSQNNFSKEMKYDHLSQGVYLIKLYNERLVITERLVIY